MLNTIGKQFAHPNGICGRLATKVMNLMNHKMLALAMRKYLKKHCVFILAHTME